MMASLRAVATMAYFCPPLDRILLKYSPSQFLLLCRLLAAIRNACEAALGFFFSNWLLMSLPPEIFLFGQRFSHDTNLCSVAHLLRSVPVSDNISSALISLTPNISVTSI